MDLEGDSPEPAVKEEGSTEAPSSPHEEVRFRDHFWGSDPAACYKAAAGVGSGSSASDREGLDVLERATGVSVDVAAELVAFLTERAEAEEQYARRLRRLAGVDSDDEDSEEDSENSESAVFGAAREDMSAGLRALLGAAAKEARAAARAHGAAAAAYGAAAAAVREEARGYKAARKGLLGAAGAAAKEKAQLEGAVRKQAARYAETVARKDAAAAAVAAATAQGRALQDVARQRARAQRAAKDEMVADQGVKEAVERLAAHHPAWVARMQAAMDGLQAREEQRLASTAAALAAAAAAQRDAAPAALAAAQQVAQRAAALDPAHELAPWARRAHTGAAPGRPPIYLPRASRARPTEAVAEDPQEVAAGGASSGRARVLRTFVGEEADELDMFAGDFVDVLATCSDVGCGGWWIGRAHGRVGWFPAAFVELVSS